MQKLKKIGLLALPTTFLLAGTGMLILLKVRAAAGSFFDQIRAEEQSWLLAHVFLLGSTICMLPAALTLRRAITHKPAKLLGDGMVVVVAVTATLLAGQYAIDFVMPLLAEVGGNALQVHSSLFSSILINTLFYFLPNFLFLALLILTLGVAYSRHIPWVPTAILLGNWAAVILGNLIHPAFQRVAILLLAFSFLPLVIYLWKNKQE